VKVLPEIWEEILSHVFAKLWKSILDRVEAVIGAKGWYTRYFGSCLALRIFFSLIADKISWASRTLLSKYMYAPARRLIKWVVMGALYQWDALFTKLLFAPLIKC